MHNQWTMAKSLTPPQIRDAELPKALRGFDVEATRSLLADAAAALGTATRERDELRRQVEQLSMRAAENPTDAERLGAVLLTAKRAGEELVAKAAEQAAEVRADAERLRAEVEAQRTDLFAHTQAEAEAMVSEARATVEALTREADEVRRTISLHREEFMTFLRTALAQLESLESLRASDAEPAGLDGELLAQLPIE